MVLKSQLARTRSRRSTLSWSAWSWSTAEVGWEDSGGDGGLSIAAELGSLSCGPWGVLSLLHGFLVIEEMRSGTLEFKGLCY